MRCGIDVRMSVGKAKEMAGVSRQYSHDIRRDGGRTSLQNRFGMRPIAAPLDLDLLRDPECIVDLYAEVSHGAFQLGMTKQELNGPKVLGPFVY